MAVAALSPVKILSDLGYEVWEMENDADMRSALIEAINTLTLTNSSDGRIPVLQDAVKNIQRPKFKTKKVSVDKLMNRKVSSDQKLSPQKLLPAASEEGGEKDQTIITSNLAERLSSIQESLRNLGRAFRQQLFLDKKVAAVDARNAKEEAKLAKENKLEKKKKSKFGGFGFKKLIKPVSGFFDTILNFFKNVFIGSILVGMLDWMKDNEDKVIEFKNFFTKHLNKILIGLGALAGLALLSPILGLLKVLGWGAAILAWPLRRLWKMRLGGVGGPKPKLRGPRSRLRGNVPITKGNWFTRGLNKIYPFKSKASITKGGNFFSRNWSKMFGGKGVSGIKPKGLGGIKPKLGGIKPKLGGIKPGGIPILGALFSLWDFGSRKSEGQTNVQAASGVGGGWLGALATTALAGVLIPEPTTSIAGGITLAILGSLGYNVGGMISDQMTGVNDDVNRAQISPSTPITPPPITSPTGTGNIEFLDLRGGGGQQQSVSGGGDGSGEEETVPSFSSQDPNNMTTIMVRSIYGLVN
jgi:hypothetical protein